MTHFRNLVAALLIFSGGCSPMPAENVKIDGLPYSFPRFDVDRVVLPKDGMLYVRLKKSNFNYILILDSMVDRAEDERGHLVVANLNFSSYAKTETVNVIGGPVICRDRIGFNCGIRINDSGVRWSVLFNIEDLHRVNSIRKLSSRQVATYRGE